MRAARATSLLGVVLAMACGTPPDDPPPPATSPPSDAVLLAERTARFHVVEGGTGPVPLLVLLHGYGGNGEQFAEDFGFDALTQPMVWVAPDGVVDVLGNRAWNASPNQRPPWHVAYLRALIVDAQQRFPIDPARIYVFGHSMGAHMAMRMGCDGADLIAAVGTSAAQQSAKCAPSQPVSLVALHGIDDEVITYGGDPMRRVPSAPQTVELFAKASGCGALAAAPRTLDLDRFVPGPETSVQAAAGCPEGIAVELWTMAEVGHRPDFAPDYARTIFDFLQAHAR